MRKRLIKVVANAVILSLILLPSVALAEPPVEGPAEETQEELSVSDLAQELGLTPEQKEQIKEQRYEAQLK